VQRFFPGDQDLVNLGAQSYFGYPLVDDAGKLLGIMVALYRSEISNLEQLERLFSLFSGIISRELTIIQKNRSLTLAGSVIESAREAILVVSKNLEVKYTNSAFEKISGFSESEVIGKSIGSSKFYKVDRNTFKLIMEVIDEHGFWQGELLSKRKDGVSYNQWLKISLDSNDNYIWQFSDISSRDDVSTLIHFQANFDGLTCLPNRHLFEDRLNQAICHFDRYHQSFAIMFMDLDGFKKINDGYGHVVGDKLLQNVSLRLKQRLRASDTVARYGGDEFVFLLNPSISESSATQLAMNLCDSIARPFEINGTAMTISASIGIAFYPKDGDNVEQLISKADAAMYTAKQQQLWSQ
jgi:diguanylate cyclase (GGDEF)-like protein/PAS domain S-box-containing protein